MKQQIKIDGGYYLSDSLPLTAQQCINLYPHQPLTEGSISAGALFRTPGISQLQYIGIGAGRGFHKFQKSEILFQVSGNQLISQTSYNSTPTLIGTISGSGPVSMADNGLVLCIIVPGSTGYFYTIATGILSTITDPVFVDFQSQQGGVTSVCTKDGRFVYTTDLEFFLGSVPATNSGKDFDALDYEDAEVNPDPIVRALEINNELYIFNSETTELYSNIGGSAFPYQRISGATVDKGLKSRFGVVSFDRSFMFLGNSKYELPAIWMTTSGAAQKVSTTCIDTLLQSYTDTQLKAVRAWTYMQDGHRFAGWTLPDQTIVFDSTASESKGIPIWHVRQSSGSRWVVNDCVSIYGHVIVNHYIDGRVGDLSRDYPTEYNAAITRTMALPYIFTNSNSFTISSAELQCTSGSGRVISDVTQTGYDLNPSVEMFISKTGARDYTSVGSRNLGADGQYQTRQIWRRLGRAQRDIIFKFETSSIALFDFQRLDIEIKGS